MIEVTYHYNVIQVCGDGCCHEDNSYVEFSSEYGEDVVRTAMFDYSDLVYYLEARFGKDWREEFYINEDDCSFY